MRLMYKTFPSQATATELEQLQPSSLIHVSMDTWSRRTLPRPHLCSSPVCFQFTSEDSLTMTDTQELCPNGLISLDRQDLDQALAGTATAALPALHICRSTSRCSSEPSSFVSCERNREGEGTESWEGEVWRRMVGAAFRKNVEDILMGCTEGKI